MSEIPLDSPLVGLFRDALEQAFRETRELYSPQVADHLASEVLREFVHVDRIFRLRDAAGHRVEELPGMLRITGEKEGPERRLEVDAYIGDFSLFMTGFFPSALRRDRWKSPAPMIARVGSLLVTFSEPVDYYAAEGRNAYERASETARIFAPGECGVYGPLCRRFDEYRRVLERVKELLDELPQIRRMDDTVLG